MIPGIPQADSQRLLELIRSRSHVQKIVLYGSRALGRQRAGSDIDLCLEAPSMELGELLELGAALDDLLLPWQIDLQLRHLIAHEGLVAHIERAGQLLWERSSNERNPQPTL
ncbi:nucleotidyltransferase domain-containing protein [Synechococcus sp. BMK-MC-1]|uniref:nucleotidyltransferase domain-containing protein n=1 Tax=Synechococcus sp. BMK-MC-1 TaxID=1442551 RepID=UPI0016441F0F|nr:nucleotidyltransferase domain-containing protein [Synechococcus sp. BMK-MC-1]QNI66399.1 putative nucleotidyltransferase domain protein [Synechococcus sp. BMK-MC-1]